jgi:protein-L-isoaspartate(D-aspartate) O-methyltransferase
MRAHFTAVVLLALVALAGGCTRADADRDPEAARRARMVEHQIEARGVKNRRVLAAMRKVPRHEFVPADLRALAYEDGPLPIGEEQTISQPYIVAIMTELARPTPNARVLEIGTGSGYQAAVLAELVREVYTIEIVPSLCRRAAATLRRLAYDDVFVRCGDGYRGWPEKAPFDAVVVTAAAPELPQPLIDQLRQGGRLVIPVGEPEHGELMVVTKTAHGLERRSVEPVAFVPMTGEVQRRRDAGAPR